MAGGAKNRAKKDRHAQLEQSSEAQKIPVQQPVRAYDGPGESSRGAPPSSAGGTQGRGRSGSTAPPSAGQQSVRSPSRGRTPSQVRGTATNLLPDRSALMSAARYVDLPGNAYVLGQEVSHGCPGPVFQKGSNALPVQVISGQTPISLPFSNPSVVPRPPSQSNFSSHTIVDWCIHRRFPTASLALHFRFPFTSLFDHVFNSLSLPS